MGSTPLYKSSLHEDRLLRVILDRKKCKGIGICEQVCPRNCFKVDKSRQITTIPGAPRCIQCGACIIQCPFDALYFKSPKGDIISPDIIRKFKLNLMGKRIEPSIKRKKTMKSKNRFIKIIVISVLLFLIIFSTFIISFGQELSGEEIISKVNELINQDTVQAKVKMTITTTSGQKRIFVYDSYSKNKGEKNLIRYIEPKRVKGQAILMLNYADDIWMYFPRTKRILKLATNSKSQKMEGSDFFYEDTGASDAFIEDFNSKKLGSEKKEGYDCYKIEMLKKEGIESGYSRLIMWIIKDNFYPIVIDYYDRENPELLLKTLIQYDIKEIDSIPIATKMVMYNKQENSQTSIEMLEVKYNIELDDSLFTERNLKKR